MRFFILLALLFFQFNLFAISKEQQNYFNDITRRKQKPKIFYAKGIEFEKEGDIKRAIKAYSNGLKDCVDAVTDDLIRQHLADLYIKEKSSRAFSEISKIHNPQLRLLMEGKFYLETGDALKAFNAFSDYFYIFKSDYGSDVALNLAESLFQCGRINDALGFYMNAFSYAKSNNMPVLMAKACYGKAWCYLRKGNYSSAKIFFKSTKKISKDQDIINDSQQQLALIDNILGQRYFESAVEAENKQDKIRAAYNYKKVVDNFYDCKNWSAACFRLGAIYASAGSNMQAIEVYKKIISAKLPESKIARERINNLK